LDQHTSLHNRVVPVQSLVEWSDVRAYLESATNLTVRDISVSYEAPESWLSYFKARSMRFTLQGRNLFKITNYWSFDPQFNNFGRRT